MSVTVVGSVALDTVITPSGRNDEGLGGTATFFSLAASHYTQVHLVGVVGTDFPDTHVQLLTRPNIGLEGLERVEGRTFRWTGKYHQDLNMRDTLDTQLNVFEHFHPKLETAARDAKYLFLGNIHPALQLEVLDQASAQFVALDTMDLWIRESVDALKEVLKRVDALIVNDQEVFDLTGERNPIAAAARLREMGPHVVVIKKGEHGCLLFSGEQAFATPALLLGNVVDPTGAGDTFAGGFLGHIASQDSTEFDVLRKAVVHGTVAASFTCESFSADRLAEVTQADIDARYKAFEELTGF